MSISSTKRQGSGETYVSDGTNLYCCSIGPALTLVKSAPFLLTSATITPKTGLSSPLNVLMIDHSIETTFQPTLPVANDSIYFPIITNHLAQTSFFGYDV